MRDIFADDRLACQFFNLIEDPDPRNRFYAYRLRDGRPLRPALLKGAPYPALFDDLRDEHGGGDFQIMIRRGSVMLLSGLLRIAAPLRRPNHQNSR